LSNPSLTHFLDAAGERIIAHRVPLPDDSAAGVRRLAQMAALAIEDCLRQVPQSEWSSLPLLLCLPEGDRAGRDEDLDVEILRQIERELQTGFASASGVIAQGRVSVPVALLNARRLLQQRHDQPVLIAAVDSLLNWPSLREIEESDRLLTGENSDGFIPGEGAGAILVGSANIDERLRVSGIGFAMEKASIRSAEPLRGDGLTAALQAAFADASLGMHYMDLRIADMSGEQYYFKEGTLALGRTLRRRKEQLDVWLPAECVGETGAAIGAVTLAVAEAACRKGYAPGRRMLLHFSADDGKRAALVLEFGAA
jgi:3-oxoacyl-[acyl-carrier-protein] synthase I